MRRLTGREKRLIVMTALAAGAVAGDAVYRHWSPGVALETEHYRILSSATDEQTREVGQVAEIVYAGYLQLLGDLGRTPLLHRKLGLKLFRDREEFRRCNRMWDGTEAFYRARFCYQYYAAGDANPYDSIMHETTHQLHNEVAGLRLSLWLEEGLACYVATSRIVESSLHLGELDPHTYLVSWVGTLSPSGDLDADKQKRSIIPLHAILSGRGGPKRDERFNNLYYLQWWSLTHFLMHYENGKYRAGLSRLIGEGGTPAGFEQHIGPIDAVEKEWYAYLPDLLEQANCAGL